MDSVPAPGAAPPPAQQTPSPEAQPATKPAENDPGTTEAPQAETMKREKPRRRETAESLASRQREISVSEFFTKNRHLLGFDNPQKALLTAIKEAVDNSLDACEEAGILPVLKVEIDQLAEDRFRVAVQDNGPGIVKAQIPKIFGKLLYGSKFHTLKQARGTAGDRHLGRRDVRAADDGQIHSRDITHGPRTSRPTTTRSRSTPGRTPRR